MRIEGTKNTPNIIIENGLFEIKGRSIPEDAHEFFALIHNEIKSFSENITGKTEIRFHLEYINSGSKKNIANILAHFNDLYLKGKDITVYWHYDYDDESILELGNDFRSMLQIPFKVIEIEKKFS